MSQLPVASATRVLTVAEWRMIESVINALAVEGRLPLSALSRSLDQASFIAACQELAFPVRREGDELLWQSPVDMLDAERISVAVAPSNLACTIRVQPLVDSTNECLKRSPQAGASPNALFAEAQWAGRGRRDRRWHSRFAESVMVSLRIATGRPLAQLPGAAIVAGVAVARCLVGLGVRGIGLKWPNDVLLDGAKVGGILVEAVASAAPSGTDAADGTGTVVIGIGVNWRSPDQGEQALGQPAAGLAGSFHDGREALAATLLAALLEAMQRFSSDGIAPFLDGFAKLDQLAGQAVVIEEQGKRRIGIARGLTNDGALRVEHDDGVRIYRSAEVSLRRLATESTTPMPISASHPSADTGADP